MAWHPNLASLVGESLPEYLAVARHATRARKEEGGGWYDFPAALLLLVIVDVIGSFHEGDKAFRIRVDGRDRMIDTDGAQHFFILNSDVYGLSLSEAQINIVYKDFRCLLAHNASLPSERFIGRDRPEDSPFGFYDDTAWINVPGLLAVTEAAVPKFLATAETRVLVSRRAGNIVGRFKR